MRHQRLRRKLGVKANHRKAMLRNLVISLVERKRIRTTLARAKEASAFADQMVTLAKRGDLHAHRLLASKLSCKDTAKSLIRDIAPRFKERQGGYTRVLRLVNRPGDNSRMALLEFTELIEQEKKDTNTKKKGKKSTKAKSSPAPEVADKPEAPSKKAKDKPETKAEQPTKEEPKESDKRGGFLGSLRKFLKGDENS